MEKLNSYAFQYKDLPKWKILEILKMMEEKRNNTMPKLNSKSKLFILQYMSDNFKNKNDYMNFKDIIKLDLQNPNANKRMNFSKLGLKTFTDKEWEEQLLLHENDFYDPFKGKKALWSGERKTDELIELKQHQKDFLMGLFLGNLPCGIVFHGVGTGKTYTAVATASLYLQLYPKNRVVFISPSAVIYNFIESLIYYGINPNDRRYHFYTYDKWYRSKDTAEDALLIVDEAHNFRTQIKVVEDEEGNKKITQNLRGYSLLERGGKLAHKAILLTATPFVNNDYDIENLLAIGEGRDPHNREIYSNIVNDTKTAYDYFKYRISKYDREFASSDFPEKREIMIPIVVPEDLEDKIIATAGLLNPFYIYTRQNSYLDNLKFNYIIEDIKKNPTKKFVCYTTFKDTGYKPLEKLLTDNNIEYGKITGAENSKKKADYINGYNQYDNKDFLQHKYRVLIISRAGAEGVNLKKTYSIYVLDGQWNEALYEQIVARAIRYESHKGLPQNENFVNVKKIFLCYKDEAKILEQVNKGVKVDFMAILNSVLEIRKEVNELNKLSSGKQSYKKANEFYDKIKEFGKYEYDDEELAKLKKGSRQRKEYLEKNKAFAKDKDKYISAELQGLMEKIPSTDYYMFILQKTKMMIINAFIAKLSKIPRLEKSVYDLEFANNLFKKVLEDKLTGSELTKFLIENLSKENKKVLDLILKIDKDENEEREKEISKLNKIITSGKAIEALNKAKQRVKINQEYFTPENVAFELWKFSQIETEYKKKWGNIPLLEFLEPSAGHGTLLKPVLQFMNKYKMPVKIDMVEYNKENRKVLEELQNITENNVLILQKTENFLKYIPNKAYHYVIMNPPFHLDKKLNKEYKKDYYDFDFVKRCYAMLELNGVIVAITGIKYKEFPEMVEWYKNKGAIIKEFKSEWKGENLKVGAEIKKLSYCFIRLSKLENDMNENEELLKETGILEDLKEIEFIDDMVIETTKKTNRFGDGTKFNKRERITEKEFDELEEKKYKKQLEEDKIYEKELSEKWRELEDKIFKFEIGQIKLTLKQQNKISDQIDEIKEELKKNKYYNLYPKLDDLIKVLRDNNINNFKDYDDNKDKLSLPTNPELKYGIPNKYMIFPKNIRKKKEEDEAEDFSYRR